MRILIRFFFFFFPMKSVSRWIISIPGRSITEGVDRRAARWQLSWRSRWSATSWTRLKVSIFSEIGFRSLLHSCENFPVAPRAIFTSNYQLQPIEFSRKDRFSTAFRKRFSPSSRSDKRRNREGAIEYRLLLLRNGAECNYSPQTDSQFTNLRGAEIVDLRLTRPRNRINQDQLDSKAIDRQHVSAV